MTSPKMKKKSIYMLSIINWYGRHPWIRLAMDCERMVEKGINFILCLGTAYDISSMESVGHYSDIFVDGKSMRLKIFYLSI